MTLPATVQGVLDTFVAQARAAFGDVLLSVVLYGSAAEQQLRASSDVNVLLLLERFEPASADRLREPLRTAQAAIRLRAMFLLHAELPAACGAFAEKFADIARRHVVLLGQDPFAALQLSRRERVLRLRQVLLNDVLRLREHYLRASLRDEQAALAVAEHAGPLRVAAAELLELSGQATSSPKAALAHWLGQEPRFSQLVAAISAAREGHLSPGRGAATLASMIEAAQWLRERALALAEE